MAIHLEIPDTVAEAMRLPGGERQQRIMIELAVSLYAQGILSFGKARQLCGMTKYEFGALLGGGVCPVTIHRKICRMI